MTASRKISLPTVDLDEFRRGGARERRRIATRVDDCCRDHGFLLLAGHGVDDGIIDAAWSAARAFFDRPLEEKLRLVPDTPNGTRGYFPLERETLTRSRGIEGEPDRKESFSIGASTAYAHPADSFFAGENLWPDQPDSFETALTDYYRAMEELAFGLLELFAAALHLPRHYFRPYFDRHESALRALNYPATGEKRATGARAGAHSDYGSLTILRADPEVPGLEIETAAGDWQAVAGSDAGFIVNIGDLMARWTNDRWTSTVHRVSGAGPRRQSIAFFQNPNADAEIACLPSVCGRRQTPRYSPVLAGRYLEERFSRAVRTS